MSKRHREEDFAVILLPMCDLCSCRSCAGEGGFSESRGRHWKGLDERWLPADQLTHHPQHPQTTLPHTKLHLGVILRRERLKVKIHPAFGGQAGGGGGQTVLPEGGHKTLKTSWDEIGQFV